MNPRRNFYRYLPRNPHEPDWGVRVLDAGHGTIPPRTPYPPQGHPEDHEFSWESGRKLQAYTFVYITRGGGVFESEASAAVAVRAGCVFVVFPGVWHRYRPESESGWDEYWVECEGDLLEKAIRHADLRASQPVLHVGLDEPLLRCFLNIADTIGEAAAGFEPIIGIRSVEIVARIRSLLKTAGRRGPEELVKQVIVRMRGSLDGAINLQQLAKELGLGYSTFRRVFKEATGRAPGDYFIEMKMNRARQLLPGKSIQEVADQLGFESIYYFSRLFKAKTGKTPGSIRGRQGNA